MFRTGTEDERPFSLSAAIPPREPRQRLQYSHRWPQLQRQQVLHHHVILQQGDQMENRAPLPGCTQTHPTRRLQPLIRMRPWETQVRQLRRRANRPQKHPMRGLPLLGRALCRLRLQPRPGGQSNMPEATIRRKTNLRHLRRRQNRLIVGEARLLVPAPPCLLQMPQGMPKQVGFFYEGETAR